MVCFDPRVSCPKVSAVAGPDPRQSLISLGLPLGLTAVRVSLHDALCPHCRSHDLGRKLPLCCLFQHLQSDRRRRVWWCCGKADQRGLRIRMTIFYRRFGPPRDAGGRLDWPSSSSHSHTPCRHHFIRGSSLATFAPGLTSSRAYHHQRGLRSGKVGVNQIGLIDNLVRVVVQVVAVVLYGRGARRGAPLWAPRG